MTPREETSDYPKGRLTGEVTIAPLFVTMPGVAPTLSSEAEPTPYFSAV